ncbi:uncharacterized protein METZ01_LOCUS388683, partial [marine metagenome]
MSTVADHRPHLSTEEVIDLACRLYGLHVRTCEPLPSERDQNFYLKTQSNDSFVLKISSAAEKRDILDLQHQAMARLGAHHGGGIWPK